MNTKRIHISRKIKFWNRAALVTKVALSA